MGSSVDIQIRRMLGQIDSYERQIDSARDQKRQAESSKRMYEKRRRQVQVIVRNLTRSFDGIVSSASRQQTRVARDISDGVSGFSNESALTGAIWRDLEKNIEDDKYGRGIVSRLNDELRRCDAKIDGVDDTIDRCARSISSIRGSRASLVRQAKQLAKQPDATVSVHKGVWY